MATHSFIVPAAFIAASQSPVTPTEVMSYIGKHSVDVSLEEVSETMCIMWQEHLLNEHNKKYYTNFYRPVIDKDGEWIE